MNYQVTDGNMYNVTCSSNEEEVVFVPQKRVRSVSNQKPSSKMPNNVKPWIWETPGYLNRTPASYEI